MANNQPNVEADPEIEALKGKVPGIESEIPEKDEPEEKKEEEKEAEPAEKDDKKEDEDSDKENDSEEDRKDQGKSRSGRPEKYIPIKQYTDEKKSWKEKGDKLESRVKELETITAGKDGSKKNEEAIKAYADKYGVDEDSVRDLAGIIRSNEDKPAEKKEETPSISEADQRLLDEAREIKAEKLFKEEFETVAIPELKDLFPKATAEQLSAAKDELEKLATTKKYLKSDLDYVVYKEREALGKIFKEPRKGPESGRTAPDRGKSTFSAADFKDGKTSFDTLAGLSGEEQSTIIDKMDIKTYEKYMNWHGQNDGLVIHRGGKKIY